MEQLFFFGKSLILPIGSSKLAHKNTYGIRGPSQLAEMPCSNQNSLYIYALMPSIFLIYTPNIYQYAYQPKIKTLELLGSRSYLQDVFKLQFQQENQLALLSPWLFLLVLPFFPLFQFNFSLFLSLLWPSEYGLSRPRLSFCLGLKNNLQLSLFTW